MQTKYILIDFFFVPPPQSHINWLIISSCLLFLFRKREKERDRKREGGRERERERERERDSEHSNRNQTNLNSLSPPIFSLLYC